MPCVQCPDNAQYPVISGTTSQITACFAQQGSCGTGNAQVPLCTATVDAAGLSPKCPANFTQGCITPVNVGGNETNTAVINAAVGACYVSSRNYPTVASYNVWVADINSAAVGTLGSLNFMLSCFPSNTAVCQVTGSSGNGVYGQRVQNTSGGLLGCTDENKAACDAFKSFAGKNSTWVCP